MNQNLSDFRMPTYREIPNVGLYLEQTIKYVNECLAPIGISLTPSMLSNYVKHGYLDRPIRKQYYVEHIAALLFLVPAKQVLSMENIATLFALQKKTYSLDVAYTYYCNELEQMIHCVFSEEKNLPEVTEEMPFEKRTLRSVIIAISQIIYLSSCFEKMQKDEENK